MRGVPFEEVFSEKFMKHILSDIILQKGTPTSWMRFLRCFQWWSPIFVSSHLPKSLQHNQQPQIHTPQTVHVHCLAKAALSYSVQTLVFLICPRRSMSNGTAQGWSPPKHGSTVDVAGIISTGVNILKMILKYTCVAAKTRH